MSIYGGFYKFALSDFGIIFEVTRTSSESRSQTCLDYAESQVRKAKSNCKVERERSELRD